MMNKRLQDLLERYRKGACNPDEVTELLNLVLLADNRVQIESWINAVLETSGEQRDLPDERKALLQAIFNADQKPAIAKNKIRAIPPWWKAVAAAAVVLLLCSGIYILVKKSSSPLQEQAASWKTDVLPPTGAKTILTLGNGKRISLDSVKNGLLAAEGKTKVNKLDSMELVYRAEPGPVKEEDIVTISYNTLSTAKGGQSSVVLPDGTKVWLNASSSLRFPTAFTGKQRKVEMTGEAYFEVAHSAKQPFMVLVNGIEIKDVGTSFNVNGYNDEPATKATLLEGSILLTSGK